MKGGQGGAASIGFAKFTGDGHSDEGHRSGAGISHDQSLRAASCSYFLRAELQARGHYSEGARRWR